MLLGAIADDYTGASDLAGMLAEQGARTVQTMGLPDETLLRSVAGRYDATVIALKSRSTEPEKAVRISLEALEGLRKLGARQIQFKYCSTFDSTEKGNIGPVIAALLSAMGEDFTVAVPALPVNGRTQYNGYLYVGEDLVSDSPMKDHPLNQMREPNLVRHLQRQTDQRVGLIAWPAVQRGPEAIRNRIAELRREAVAIALVDVLTEADLEATARACVDLRLITGGSGLARQLPAAWREQGLWEPKQVETGGIQGGVPGVLTLAGSCSAATLGQLRMLRQAGGSTLAVDVPALLRDGTREKARLLETAREEIERRGRATIYSSASAKEREELLAGLGKDGGPEGVRLAIEGLFSGLARAAVKELGVRRLVVAGGETSGAALEALGVEAAEVLDTLDPGVPVLLSLGEPRLGLALKSGNFGSADFFLKATDYLEAL